MKIAAGSSLRPGYLPDDLALEVKEENVPAASLFPSEDHLRKLRRHIGELMGAGKPGDQPAFLPRGDIDEPDAALFSKGFFDLDAAGNSLPIRSPGHIDLVFRRVGNRSHPASPVVHDEDVEVSFRVGDIGDLLAVRRPARIPVVPGIVGQFYHFSTLEHINIIIAIQVRLKDDPPGDFY